MKKVKNIKFSNLIGKSVIVIDFETTGIPVDKKYNSYHDYKLLEYYEPSRPLSLAWYHTDSFTGDININDIHHHYIKPIGYSDDIFSKKAFEKNGISKQFANDNGIPFIQLLKKECHFLDDLFNAEYLIHHSMFDYYILQAEVYRLLGSNTDFYGNYEEIVNQIKVVDTMELTKNILRLPFWSGQDFKYPMLGELYHHCFNEDITNGHNAKYDVFHLTKSIVYLASH